MGPDGDAIAVIGIACRYPGASDPRLLWENILTRRRQFRRMPDQRLPLADYHDPDPGAVDKTYGTRAAVLDGFEFDWVKWRIPKKAFESTDIVHWLALDVAQRAFADAGYAKRQMPKQHSGVILGNTLTGEQTRSQTLRLRWPYVRRVLLASARSRGFSERQAVELAETMEGYYKSVFAPITEDSLAGGLSNTIAGRICNYFDLHGGGYSVDGACSSSLIAVVTAARSLANGDLDLALAGGVDVSLDTFELIGFAKTGALSATDMRVYDRRASGFIPGEGCGFVVLKRLRDARADGDYVYATFSGWGLSSDGKGGITAPSGGGQSMALSRAYTRSGHVTPTLDFVEGHGTGTSVGDREELKGLAMALGDLGETPLRPCGITSVKSLIGHTKAAAGIAGFIKAVLAVNQRVLPPTAGCTDPNPVFANEARHVYPILRGEVRSPTSALRAGVSAMGFGGINSHVILESADPPSDRLKPDASGRLDERALLASSQESELFVLASASADGLLRQLLSLAEATELMSDAEMVDLAAGMAGEVDSGKPWRASIVARSPAALGVALNELERMLAKSPPSPGETVGNRQVGVWLGNRATPPRLGFLFPGQGSQQLNMARRLVERHPWARELTVQFSEWMQAPGERSECASTSFVEHIFKPTERALDEAQLKAWKGLLTRTEIAQPAICLCSLLWLGYLERLGLRPSIVGGHSLGELTAFYAAGAFDAQTLLGLAVLRGEAMSASGEAAGTMASLACSRQQAQELLDQVEGYIVIANINSPTQIVVSGEKDAVAHALGLAKERSIQVWELSVSNAFHSRIVAGAAGRLRADACVPPLLGATAARLLSSLDGHELRPGVELKEHFARQILAPVEFVSLVEVMDEACELLVEVGPGRILSGLVGAILGDEEKCFPVESKADTDTDLNLLLANYFARGGEVDWEVLYSGRLVRPFRPAWEMSFIENQCERPLPPSAEQQESATVADVSLTSGQAGSALAGTLGLPADLLERYLAKRGPFLTAVVKADMASMPDTASPSQTTPSSREPVEPRPAGPTTLDEAAIGVTAPAPPAALAIDDLLLDLVEQQTGFPRGTLTMEQRLLDDLNMDSIKAAELIAQIASRLGVAEEFDPAQFANASLQTIADQLEALSPSRQGGRLQATEATPVAGTPGSARRATWVRDFAFEPVAVELSPVVSLEGSPEVVGEALILYEESERDLAQALSERLQRLGGAASQATFAAGAGDEGHFAILVAVLPRLPASSRPLCERLPVVVERLQAPLRCLAGSGDGATPATVVFVQFGGGFFGKGSLPGDPEQCGASALAASLHLEQPELKVRVLDFAVTTSPANLSERVWAEVERPERYAAVGYDEALTRRIPRPRMLEPGDYASRPGSWSSDDVVLVTGGAKGITAECVFALARETGVRLALVGSSPAGGEAPGDNGDAEVDKTLRRFREAGLTAHYYRCDVTDVEAVGLLVETVSRELGEISGVIHGAGLNKPALLGKVSSRQAISEVSPKVLGATHLCQALEGVGAPLKMFLGLSSIIGLTGMQRNGWYAFSNEALSLLLAAFRERHPTCAVLSLAFSIWDEVGMGARMGSTAYLAKLGIDPIPVTEGVARFLRLFTRDPGVHEVVTAARLGSLDTWARAESPLDSRACRFLEQIVVYVPGVETIARARLSLESDPYLRDHVWRDSHLFPTVFGLEAMAQAVAHVTGETDFETLSIEDVDLQRPIVVDVQNGTTIEIRAEVLERDDEYPGKRVKAEIAVEQTGFVRAHFSGVFVLGVAPQAPEVDVDLPAEPLDIEPRRDLYGWLLFQGDAFQRIRKVYALDAGKALIASGLERRTGGELGPERLLLGDAYFRDSMLQSVQLPLTQELCLPVALERIERYGVTQGGLSTYALILARVEEKRDREVLATILAMSEDGRVLERIRGRMRILEHRSEHPTPEALAMGDMPGQDADGQEMRQRKVGKSLPEKGEIAEPGLMLSTGAAIKQEADGRSVLVVRFPVTFREAANTSRTLYFSHYFSWIGKLRETIVEPVSREMLELFSTGEWGMVTNSAETLIGGYASSGDVIEGRAWIESLSGSADSTVEMCFQWHKLLSNGVTELLATSRMRSTWVAIRGPGLVEVRPFPEFGRRFLDQYLPPPDRRVDPASHTGSPSPADLGRELFCAPPGPVAQSSLLKELTFDTSLEDANLVGNLYFANYSVWQGRVFDRYFHELNSKTGKVKGEFRCTSCRIDHLQEAMPFDQILVRMYLRAVNERGIRLYFDYFRLTPDGQRNKIAFAEQQAAWYEPGIQGRWEPAELPAELRTRLTPKSQRPAAKRSAKTERHDVVVVGAGIGGLAAAALLAKRGRKVVVLEQHNKPGGFCTSWSRTLPKRQRKDGKPLKFVFDAGVQDIFGVTPGGNLHSLLRELDIADKIEWRRVMHEYIQSDLRLKVPWSQEGFKAELAARFPHESEGLSAFFAEVEACNRVIYRQVPLNGSGDSSAGNVLARWANRPFATMLRTYIRDERLRHLLGVLTHYISDDPTTLGALAMCPVLAYYTQGGYYPLGGAQVLPDALVSVIERHGGELRLRSPVSRILVKQGRAGGVRLADGSVLEASEVIANADLRRTYLELVGRENLTNHFVQGVESLRPSCSAFMVMLGVDMVPQAEPLTVVLDEAGRATQVGTLSKVDPSLAPPGHSRILLSSLIAHTEAGLWERGTPGYAERKQRYGDALIRIAEQAIPGLGRHIVFREDASPATFARYAWASDGAIYGLDMRERRPSVKAPIRNLSIVGAGVAPRPGVEDAVRTGMKAADAIQRSTGSRPVSG